MASEGIYIKNIGNMQEQVSNINTYTDKLKRDMSNIRDTINAINIKSAFSLLFISKNKHIKIKS